MCIFNLLTSDSCFLVVFSLVNNSVDHRYKTYEANHRSNLDSHCAEDILIECCLIRACTAHQYKTNDNY